MSRTLLLVGAAAGALISFARAQETAPPDADTLVSDAVEQIVIQGVRRRGVVTSAYQPEITYDEEDVASLGASSFADILEALAPQTGSGRGRSDGPPAVLLNGRRIAGFRELRNYPPESIQRVEILSEDAALRFGFRADQRVINFILKDSFSAYTIEAEVNAPTEGGRTTPEIELGRLAINDGRRFNLDFRYTTSSELLESERDLRTEAPSPPYSLIGNITAPTIGDEIDPALSALAGFTTTVAAVPETAAGGAPVIADFVAGANDPRFTDLGAFRTLAPESDEVEFGAGYNLIGPGDIAITLSGEATLGEQTALLGLPTASLTLDPSNPFSDFSAPVALHRYVAGGGALRQETDSLDAESAITIASAPGVWTWTIINEASFATRDRETETGFEASALQTLLDAGDAATNPFGSLSELGTIDTQTSETRTLSTGHTALATIPLLALPGGDLASSWKLEYRTTDQQTDVRDASGLTSASLYRGRATAQASFEVPIYDAEGWGALAANLNGAIDDYSDFGTLSTWGAGLVWSPNDIVRLSTSYNREEGAPSIGQLGDPVIVTPNVRVFDFTTGDTALVDRTTGGADDLRADDRQVVNIGLRLTPLGDDDVALIADYTETRTDDPISGFPTPTAEIEGAFPGRFTRDINGDLIALDARPINFAQSERRQLRWGINLSKRLSASRGDRPSGASAARRAPSAQGGGAQGGRAQSPHPQRPAGAPPSETASNAPSGDDAPKAPTGAASSAGRPQVAPGGAGGQQRSGPPSSARPGGGGRGGPPRGGRLFLSIYHTAVFEDSILIAPGVPELDLLNGSAVGSSGGTSAHSIQARGGIFKNGFGMRADINWRSGTDVFVDPSIGPSSDEDLYFSDLLTTNIGFFVDLGRRQSLVKRYPWLSGTRVSFRADNIFNDRLEVRDGTGATPFAFQRDLIDPVGRTVEFEIRKAFL